MPTLDLGDWEYGQIGRVATSYKILAVMLHPDNPAYQKEYLVSVVVKWLADLEEAGESETFKVAKDVLLPEGSFKTLLRTPSPTEMSKRVDRVSRQGQVAGDILYHIIQLEKNDHRGSVNKAEHLLKLIYRDVPQAPHNHKDIWNFWTAYKSVSPFWAAKRVIFDSLHTDTTPSQFQENISNDIPTFLAIADYFRQFGIRHIPQNQTSPILNPNETWSFRGSIPLPSVEVLIPQLTTPEMEWLAKYRAPKRFHSP